MRRFFYLLLLLLTFVSIFGINEWDNLVPYSTNTEFTNLVISNHNDKKLVAYIVQDGNNYSVKVKLLSNSLNQDTTLVETIYTSANKITDLKVNKLNNNQSMISWYCSQLSDNINQIYAQVLNSNDEFIWEDARLLFDSETYILFYNINQSPNNILYVSFCYYFNFTIKAFDSDYNQILSYSLNHQITQKYSSFQFIDNQFSIIYHNITALNVVKISESGEVTNTSIDSTAYLSGKKILCFVKDNNLFVGSLAYNNELRLIKLNHLLAIQAQNTISLIEPDYSYNVEDFTFHNRSDDKNIISYSCSNSDTQIIKYFEVNNNLAQINYQHYNIWIGNAYLLSFKTLLISDTVYYQIRVNSFDADFINIQALSSNNTFLFNNGSTINYSSYKVNFEFLPNQNNTVSLLWISSQSKKLYINDINPSGYLLENHILIDQIRNNYVTNEQFFQIDNKIVGVWLELAYDNLYHFKYQIFDFNGTPLVCLENQEICTSIYYTLSATKDNFGNLIVYFPTCDSAKFYVFNANDPFLINNYTFSKPYNSNYPAFFINPNQSIIAVINNEYYQKYVKFINGIPTSSELLTSTLFSPVSSSDKNALVYFNGAELHFNIINDDFEPLIGNFLSEDNIVNESFPCFPKVFKLSNTYAITFIDNNNNVKLTFRNENNSFTEPVLLLNNNEQAIDIFLFNSNALFVQNINVSENSTHILKYNIINNQLSLQWERTLENNYLYKSTIINDKLVLLNRSDNQKYIQAFTDNGDFIYDNNSFLVDNNNIEQVAFHKLNNNKYLISGINNLIANIKLFSLEDSPVSTHEIPIPCPQTNLDIYPNPFNPITNISFNLTEDSKVVIEVFNVKGQKVSTLENSYLLKGNHTISWNSKNNNNNDLASGIYFCRFATNNKTITKKMLLLK